MLPGMRNRVVREITLNGFPCTSFKLETWIRLQNDTRNIADQKTPDSKIFDPPILRRIYFPFDFGLSLTKNSINLVSQHSSMDVGKRVIAQNNRNAILIKIRIICNRQMANNFLSID